MYGYFCVVVYGEMYVVYGVFFYFKWDSVCGGKIGFGEFIGFGYN